MKELVRVGEVLHDVGLHGQCGKDAIGQSVRVFTDIGTEPHASILAKFGDVRQGGLLPSAAAAPPAAVAAVAHRKALKCGGYRAAVAMTPPKWAENIIHTRNRAKARMPEIEGPDGNRADIRRFSGNVHRASRFPQ